MRFDVFKEAWRDGRIPNKHSYLTREEVARRELYEEIGGTAREGEITNGPSALVQLWCAPLLQPTSQTA